MKTLSWIFCGHFTWCRHSTMPKLENPKSSKIFALRPNRMKRTRAQANTHSFILYSCIYILHINTHTHTHINTVTIVRYATPSDLCRRGYCARVDVTARDVSQNENTNSTKPWPFITVKIFFLKFIDPNQVSRSGIILKNGPKLFAVRRRTWKCRVSPVHSHP